MTSLIILIPVYKPKPDALEILSLDVSIAALGRHELCFIYPRGMNLEFYTSRYLNVSGIEFEPESFASVQGYSRLLLSPDFYARFASYEFMLILQTDAVVLRDELDYWCDQPFDYVGAPWPDGVELMVNLDRFAGDKGHRVRALVGNGGLSLRRINKCVALIQEFPQAANYFVQSGSSEDLFFGFMGVLSSDFVLPNEMTASLFSMELKPSLYYATNGNRLPMGGHAWWKYEPKFWLPHIPGADSLLPINL